MFDDPMRQIKSLIREEDVKPLFECKYPGPGNRYGIKPGHRWDGVMRGNGFEFKHIEHKNILKDKHEEEMREYLLNL
jgi:pre-mRNA-splicing factor CWC26